MSSQLSASGIRLAYDNEEIVHGIDLVIPPGKITVIVGANACGKSTTLRALARLLKPRSGVVLLDGADLAGMPTKQIATKLGILPQGPVAPEGLTVGDLVARGRYPHQKLFQQWTDADELAVRAALESTNTTELVTKNVDELSGGQRQRAWIAMVLAQETGVMLLDEPTTFLDIAHQIEVLDLLAELNAREGRTIVLVLHELNQAARYADHIVAMKAGNIVAEGPPDEVLTEELVADVFGMPCRIVRCPVSDAPLVVPIGAFVRVPRRVPAACD